MTTHTIIIDACHRLRADLADLDDDGRAQLAAAVLHMFRASGIALAIESLAAVLRLAEDLAAITPQMHPDDQRAVRAVLAPLLSPSGLPS